MSELTRGHFLLLNQRNRPSIAETRLQSGPMPQSSSSGDIDEARTMGYCNE